MTWIQAIIIAIIEGLTEFLPISSTAHMKFAQAIMHISKEDSFVNMFDIVIQFAAILAVFVLYWKKFVNFKDFRFYIKLIVAVIPALILGALFKKHIESVLGNITTIACVTIAGGVLLLFIERFFKQTIIDDENEITYATSFKIGLFQVLAIVFPGLSRSAATILGGLSSKLTRRLAAEFSFFLAVPTMAAATAKEIYDTFKAHPASLQADNTNMLAIGCIVAFIVSIISMRFFINFVSKHGFRAFGVYRIIAGSVILYLALHQVI